PALRVHADLLQMKAVLNGLLQNAADSLPQNGSIKLRAFEAKDILAGEVSRAVIIEVEDNGSGIREEFRDKIFEPFFSTKAAGLGLGLARAAQIIENHSGTLTFETQICKGTTFRIALPISLSN